MGHEGLAARRQRIPPEAELAGIYQAWWILVALIVVWVIVFGSLVVLRQNRFASFGFDMGIFDQAVWLISHNHGLFITVRGLQLWGHHAEPGLYLFAPFYWLGAGPNFLNVVQVVSEASGAVPIFLLARDRLRHPWLALALAAAFLLHPALQFMAWELFHPEVMAITPLLFAYWLALRRRWGWFTVCVVYAGLWKEDVLLALLVLGIIVAIRHNRRIGLALAGVTLAWFVVVTRVILPAVNGVGAFYTENFFGDLGKTPGQILVNAIRHPHLVTKRLVAPDARHFLWQMTASFGLVAPLCAPAALAIGLPQVLADLLSVNNFTRTITYHYAALPLTALALATVEGLRRLRRPTAIAMVVGVVLASSVTATLAWGPSPIGHEYRRGWWPLYPDSRLAAKRAAIALVPPRDSASVTYLFTAHMTHRERLYEFPNPWQPRNWGVHDENEPSPSVVQWLVIDRQLVGGNEQLVTDRVLGSGDFQIVYDMDDIFVARRIRPGDEGGTRHA